MNLSRNRVEALLQMAGQGEDDFTTFWIDTWNIDITQYDSEIRRQFKEQVEDGADPGTLEDALEAAKTYRDYRAARAVLSRRYINNGKGL